MVSGDLPQSSRNLQDCKKVLQKLTYLHQSHSLSTHSCPSQRRGKPEKSPSPVVQIKVMLRIFYFFFQLKSNFFFLNSGFIQLFLLLGQKSQPTTTTNNSFGTTPGNGIFNISVLAVRSFLYCTLHEAAKPYISGVF